jgi:ABC-type Fe3+ transport system permease subunit
MELPLDVQGNISCLDIDERVEQRCAIAGVLHVLARFILVLQMQHLRGIRTYREEVSRTKQLGSRRRLSKGKRGALLVCWWRIRLTLTTPYYSLLYRCSGGASDSEAHQ